MRMEANMRKKKRKENVIKETESESWDNELEERKRSAQEWNAKIKVR